MTSTTLPVSGAIYAAARPNAISDRRWDPLLACLAVFLLIAVGRTHQLIPGLDVFRPGLIAGGLALLLFLTDSRPQRRVATVLRFPATRLLLGFLACVALSVPGALYQGLAFGVLVGSFVKSVAMFVLLVGAVRGFRDVERLAGVYFVGVAFYAVVVLANVGGGDRWGEANRVYYDANDFATLAVTAVPIGLYFAGTTRPLGQRLMGALGLGPLAAAFVSTGSRGGFLAMLVVGALILVRLRAIKAIWRVLGAGALAAILVITATDEYWEDIRSLGNLQEDYNLRGEEGRIQVWKRGLGYVLQRPLFGVGVGNFPVAEGTISPLAERGRLGRHLKWSAAHNSYVQVIAELGILALAVFLVMLRRTFDSLARVTRLPGATRSGRGPPQLAQALQASLLGFLTGAFFLSLAYAEMLYALMALAVALQKISLPVRIRRTAPAVRAPV